MSSLEYWQTQLDHAEKAREVALREIAKLAMDDVEPMAHDLFDKRPYLMGYAEIDLESIKPPTGDKEA